MSVTHNVFTTARLKVGSVILTRKAGDGTAASVAHHSADFNQVGFHPHRKLRGWPVVPALDAQFLRAQSLAGKRERRGNKTEADHACREGTFHGAIPGWDRHRTFCEFRDINWSTIPIKREFEEALK